MAKKKNNLLWIALIVGAVFLFTKMAPRQVSVDFSRTFSNQNVRPGDQVLVTYTAHPPNIQQEDPWIGELTFPDPADWTWAPNGPMINIEETTSGAIRFYGWGPGTFSFYITPQNRGTYVIGGWVYHPRDDTEYFWPYDMVSSGDYARQVISVTCITDTEMRDYLRNWLLESISTNQIKDHIRQWLLNPCPP